MGELNFIGIFPSSIDWRNVSTSSWVRCGGFSIAEVRRCAIRFFPVVDSCFRFRSFGVDCIGVDPLKLTGRAKPSHVLVVRRSSFYTRQLLEMTKFIKITYQDCCARNSVFLDLWCISPTRHTCRPSGALDDNLHYFTISSAGAALAE